MKIHHCPIEVRGYELDSFGHVNHAVYWSYLEHARWLFLKENGIDKPRLAELKQWPIIAALEGKYLKPTYLGDQLDVQSHVSEFGRSHFFVNQTIFRDGKPVFEGKVTVVMVNDQGKPVSVAKPLLVMGNP